MEEMLTLRAQGLPARQRRVEVLFSAISLAAAVALAVFAEPERAFSIPLALALRRLLRRRRPRGVQRRRRATSSRPSSSSSRCCCCCRRRSCRCSSSSAPRSRRRSMCCAASPRPSGSCWRSTTRPSRSHPPPCSIALGAQPPDWASWPAYVAALAAQFAADAVREGARARLTRAMPVRVDAGRGRRGPPGRRAAGPDRPARGDRGRRRSRDGAARAPARRCCSPSSRASATRGSPRRFELGRAYRGTALLLRDLLEDDDEYTGHHTEDVVDLSVRVAERLGVGEDVRRETELGALLHDIGKIHIPDAIINKPGKLDDEEWALMKTHTIEGQRMLDRVGGLLGSVGLVVRASHERFDGAGYPDGLAGEDDPARVADRGRLRRLQRDDHDPLVPQGDAGLGGDRRAAPLLGHAVRPRRRRRARRRRRRSGLAAHAARARRERTRKVYSSAP